MAVGRSCPGIFCAFGNGLAEQPDSRDRLRLLLRTTARGTTAALTGEGVERVAHLPFEGELPGARSVFERGGPHVYGRFILDIGGLP
ncbi:hypothetical protein GCM10022403_051760 [Streptomyces coacervatus]|uniref:Uncharacterized protein n=1 Tax=Streptomyces coacervatus TaxID=647381 RepID=A0ABP7I7Q4_9ACTN